MRYLINEFDSLDEKYTIIYNYLIENFIFKEGKNIKILTKSKTKPIGYFLLDNSTLQTKKKFSLEK